VRQHFCHNILPPPHLCYCVKFGHSRSNDATVIRHKPEKNWFNAFCLSIGHSRSLEPTRINRLPMTSYYSSTVTMHELTVSEINIAIWTVENLKFFQALVYLTPWNFVMAVGAQNTRVMPLYSIYQMVERVWRNVHSFRYFTTTCRTNGGKGLAKQYRDLHAVDADAR